MKLIDQYIDNIEEICDENGVESLFAFGSITMDKLKPESDVDLLVDIAEPDPIKYADKYFSIKFHLEELLKRHIDLLEKKAIKNSQLKESIDKTKVLIYER